MGIQQTLERERVESSRHANGSLDGEDAGRTARAARRRGLTIVCAQTASTPPSRLSGAQGRPPRRLGPQFLHERGGRPALPPPRFQRTLAAATGSQRIHHNHGQGMRRRRAREPRAEADAGLPRSPPGHCEWSGAAAPSSTPEPSGPICMPGVAADARVTSPYCCRALLHASRLRSACSSRTCT
jgi:hypothetical protein